MNLAVLAGQAGSQNAGGSIMTMVILLVLCNPSTEQTEERA